MRVAAAARDETLVLFVDQFEEVFTLARDARERSVFCAWLVGIGERGWMSDSARVVLTARDDFLTRIKQERAFRDKLEQALTLLATPDAGDLRRILVKPAERAGFTFEGDDFVDEMVRAVEGRPGSTCN